MLEIVIYIVIAYLLNMFLSALVIELINRYSTVLVRNKMTILEFFFKFMFLPVLVYKFVYDPEDIIL